MSEALILNNLGMAQIGLEEFVEAETLFRQALDRGPGPDLQARIRNNLGVALTGSGRHEAAGHELAEAFTQRRELHGDRNRDVATTPRSGDGMYRNGM